MKIILTFLALLTLVTSCSSQKQFPDKKVCFLLYNLKENKFEETMGKKNCENRLPAASTFKVALSVMAFDSGIFKSPNLPVYKWDKKVTMIENWNKDHYPESWIRESVVWMSQAVTLQMGLPKIQSYLDGFDYGNRNFSAGLKYSWLTPAPFVHEKMENSLKITGLEQIDFLKKLWRNELPASKSSQELTRKIMTHDQSPRGYTLVGKTGSGFTNQNFEHRIAWFVGHLTHDKGEYLVVMNFVDKQKQTEVSFGGRMAKEMALKLLNDKGLW